MRKFILFLLAFRNHFQQLARYNNWETSLQLAYYMAKAEIHD